MIELALPAGSLETALTAYRNGADAVYFGLKEFSARKGAVNFSLEDLSKIRRYSIENNRKTYLTINTLIDDFTIEHMLKTLDQVAYYGNDGIIIQDLGVAAIIREHYPTLKLHASTQLAVHTTDGVKQLQDMGFERVVLSRELSLKEIEKIRHDCPDVQIKAFIHGALCYGFSGLCSASYNKCHRSANGGECAQICRSWFTEEQSGRKGYFFSMEDMLAGSYLLKLNDMGIDSAKVEGRLKSPEYVGAVTRYYRSILDHGKATEEQSQEMLTTFARKQGPGYLDYKKDRPSLLSGEYPGHMGIACGPVLSQSGNIAVLQSTVPIENHDGLQYFTEDRFGLPESNKFSAEVLPNPQDRAQYTKAQGKAQRRPQHLSQGPQTTIRLKVDQRVNLTGKVLYKISDSTKREKTPSTNIPLYQKGLDIDVVLTDNAITASSCGIQHTQALTLQQAKTPMDCAQVIGRHLSESGTSRHTLGHLVFTNQSTIESPFLPPSVMKDFRRGLYAKLENLTTESPTVPEPSPTRDPSLHLPDRCLLSRDLPWSLEGTEIDGRTYYTLPPVTFNEEAMLEKAHKTFEAALSEGKRVTVGLNNIAQVRFAKEHPQYDYFADVFLYLSNRYTAAELSNQIPTLVGGYLWFERNKPQGQWPFEPTIVENFEMPSFISRTCYRHDSRGESCKNCPQKADYTIEQSGECYIVKVRSCLTVVQRLH